MNIADLKEMIKDLPDDMEVMIPLTDFDNEDGCVYFSPCLNESGVEQMTFESPEEHVQREALNLPPPIRETFMLVPCGFYALDEEYDEGEEDHEVDPILN